MFSLTIQEQADVQDFYFKVLALGYLGDVRPISDSYLPGTKSYTIYDEPGLMGVDWWFSNHNMATTQGQVVIYLRNVPVWIMDYEGHYDEGVQIILEKALTANVAAKVFNGGRGPDVFDFERYRYINTVLKNDFGDFEGEERIFPGLRGKATFGYHKYKGGWRVPVDIE